MYRAFLLLSIVFGISLSGYSQLNEVKVRITDNQPRGTEPGKFNKKSAAQPKACDRDTVQYPRIKASAYSAISIKKNYSLGQFYGAPQDITVHGFTFYAWALPGTPATDKKIRLICNIYKAGSDSLPSGSPLQSDTVTVDTTFGNGLLTKLIKHATFKKPVTVNYPYILTIESDSANLNAGVVGNSWNNNDGDSANYLCGSVSGKWYRGLSLNISGVDLNADMQIYPHVSYKFGTDFTLPACYDFKDSARFKNKYRSNVSGSIFYNVYSYWEYDWFCHQWNYGEQFWDSYDDHGITKYNGRGNFNIRLVSKVYQWHLTNGGYTVCSDTTWKVLYFKPKDPVALTNTFICRGDSANILVGSDTGTVIRWFKNPADTKPVFTGTLNRLGIPQTNDTFYLKAYNYGCESNFTRLVVSVNDYPKLPQISHDSVCQGARANLGARSTAGITEWFKDSTRLPIATGDVYQTDPLNSNVTYFVRSNNNGCLSPYFLPVTAFVDNDFAPEDPIVSPDTIICLRPSGNATLRAFSKSDDSIRWYSVSSGGTSIGSGNYYSLKAKTVGEETIYVEAQKSTCASTRVPIKVTTSDYPAITQVFSDERCKGDTAQVGVLTSAPGNVRWYTKSTGGSPVDFGIAIRYYTRSSVNLYAEVEQNGCINPVRSLATIKISAYDSITGVTVPLICGSSSASLKVNGGSNVITWYEDEQATRKLGTGATYVTPKLLVSTNYYFVAEKNGCKSPVTPVFVEVLPLPVAGYNYDFLTGHKLRLTPQASSGVTYLWRMGDGKVYTTKFVTHSYALYGTYNVKLIVTSVTSGCKDSTSQDIVYDFSGIRPVAPAAMRIVPNPADGRFTITPPKGLVRGELSFYSADGREVYHQTLDSDREIPFEKPVPPGIYTVSIRWNGQMTSSRLLIR